MDTDAQRIWAHQIARLARLIAAYIAASQPVKLSRCWMLLHKLSADGFGEAMFEMGRVKQRTFARGQMYSTTRRNDEDGTTATSDESSGESSGDADA